MKKILILVATIAFVITSCQNKQNHSEEGHDDHNNEAVKLKLTAYSNDFEVYAEADPFVVGKSADILAHFSFLNNFKPIQIGSIIMEMMVGSTINSQTLERPVRTGIYLFTVQPKTAGAGKIIFKITTNGQDYSIVVNNITVHADEKTAIQEAKKIIIPTTNTTTFTKEQSWKVDFLTELPLREPFGQIIKTSAQVLSSQGDEIIISAKTNGTVIFKGDNVLEGKSVMAGQAMFVISGNGLADNNSAVRFSEAKNNYEKFKANFERVQDLAKDKIVSEKELIQAKTEYDNARVIYENLSRNFSANGQTIFSNMNGFVKQLYVSNGQYVETGQPIIVISQNKNLVLKAEVQQKYLPLLSSIVSANIRILNDSQTYTLEQLNGKLLSYGRNASSDNYLIPINFQIDNKGSFISGSFVEMYIKTRTNALALTIPNTALIEEQGNYYVYVQITPESFEKRQVRIAVTDGIKTEIRNGLTESERIVSHGAILIKLASASNSLDPHAGHNH